MAKAILRIGNGFDEVVGSKAVKVVDSKKPGKTLGARVIEITRNIRDINSLVRNSSPKSRIPPKIAKDFYSKMFLSENMPAKEGKELVSFTLNELRNTSIPLLLDTINGKTVPTAGELQVQRENVVRELRQINKTLVGLKGSLRKVL